MAHPGIMNPRKPVFMNANLVQKQMELKRRDEEYQTNLQRQLQLSASLVAVNGSDQRVEVRERAV